jgi:NDP-sugar pyrophosphorylase family protein
MQAIILAGGQGRRLRPYTTLLPKPLMPIGDISIIEVIIRQLKCAGFDNLVVSIGYLGDLLRALIGNGRLGGTIDFVKEDRPLGTAGPLTLIPKLEDHFLVINGDTLTNLDYRAFMNFHKRSPALATIATKLRQNPVDFGVLECDGNSQLLRYVEKPVHTYRVSMGINAFRNEVLHYLRPGERKDLPELIQDILGDHHQVLCYESDCFWLDIGRPSDYEKALEIFEEQRSMFLEDGNCAS